ncbi:MULTISPECIES: TolC family protein [Sphingobacterium]|mgnify:FL=1|uniref:Membrane protein n=1 Tax=Sphingobacterium cellulitidis TaxID=1768011 RepID=A0A8H9KU85_9SPHI|nr:MULTISPECIES: TolC family protein [Sphingobacterium]MBA8988031.1 outer membrane protein TolC [Sphingobacterium soli]OYD41431.1 transporter [Sphingobacterium cellulitidis]OYD46004.1 transporter [Sphingobacterium cellulitidis]WFB62981.1 TolC family protein [Sphingobacterium sp. WM]GGE26731.1 membrane protein [Sphingobacterium soli]
MKKLVLVGFLILYTGINLFAQGLLTAKDAVQIALENNFEIKLSQNDLRVAKENLTYGNAGMLPNVTGNFTQNNSVMNSSQVQANGDKRSLSNAKNNNMSYGVSIGWTIFDGFAMFSRYEQLKELQKQGEFELKKTILAKVSDVISTYYTIVEQQNLLNAIDSSINISMERLRTAENRFMIGKASRLEVLNVQVNLNEDESSRLRQANVVKNLKISLNSLMARELNIEFDVEREVEYDDSLIYDDLLSKAKEYNPDLQIIAINKRMAELEVKRIKGNRYPVVRLNTGYNFSESESSLGFVSSSNSRGLNYGITASINLFDGFNQRRNERVAKIQLENSGIMIDQQNLFIKTAMSTAYESYQTNLSLARLEENNADIARQNLNITLEKYKIGTISAVEFRDAQENFINAVSRFNSSRLQAKLSELALKEMIGNINL